jgi:ferrochelatase
MIRRALILVNTGTPDSFGLKDVRKFLTEFLNDPRVVDLPWLIRKILVNTIIIPFRTPRSAGLYKKLWTDEGSPIMVNLEKLVAGLQEMTGNKCLVVGTMRYGNPSLKDALGKIKREDYDEIIIFPLFPHYASSTTGSVHDLIKKVIVTGEPGPSIRLISQYYSHPLFIDALAGNILQYDPEKYDHILFSYHSLPVRHINNVHPGILYNKCNCIERMPDHGKYCYRATCYETTRLISEKLNLPGDSYSTSFQSRLTRNWLAPFTDQVLTKLASENKKRVLVVSPSFTADCLETIVEIQDEYDSLFRKAGGKELVLVKSLNYNVKWINAIIGIAGLSSDEYQL